MLFFLLAGCAIDPPCFSVTAAVWAKLNQFSQTTIALNLRRVVFFSPVFSNMTDNALISNILFHTNINSFLLVFYRLKIDN